VKASPPRPLFSSIARARSGRSQWRRWRGLDGAVERPSSCVCGLYSLHTRFGSGCRGCDLWRGRMTRVKAAGRTAVRAGAWLFGITVAVSLSAGSVTIAAASAAAVRLSPAFGRSAIADHAATRGLPMLIYGSYHGIRPRNIYFSGDGGNIVGGVRWSSWTSSHATGEGQSDARLCSGLRRRCGDSCPDVDYAAGPSGRLLHPDHRDARWSEHGVLLQTQADSGQLSSKYICTRPGWSVSFP
jgi:hypothetical protein